MLSNVTLFTKHFRKTIQRATEFDPRQRYDFHRILWIREGKGTISVDFTPFDLLPDQLYFFSPRQLVSLEESHIIRADALFFNDDFLYSHANDDDFLTRCNVLDHPESPFVTLPDNESTIHTLFALIQTELQPPVERHRARILRNLLKAFLLQAERLKRYPAPPPVLTDDCMLFLSFKKNIAQHIRIHRTVAEYADALHVTPKKLNTVVKKLVGTTVHHYLHRRLLLEAKRQLYFDDRSVKEIAYDLGFGDASNFTRTFKKLEGVSPETFRQQRHRN